MRSVAIVGPFCSGKTTLADYLVEHHGYTRVSFAHRLKEIAANVYNNGRPIDKKGQYAIHREGGNPIVSGRTILQELGQAVKSLDEYFWIRWLNADLDAGYYGSGPFVSDDTRFPYEADALREQGFSIVRLSTPEGVRMARYRHLYGRLPTVEEMAHPSEVESRKIEADLRLDGTINPKDLARAVMDTVAVLAAA